MLMMEMAAVREMVLKVYGAIVALSAGMVLISHKTLEIILTPSM